MLPAIGEMAIAAAVAVVTGWLGGRLLPAARDQGWTSGAFAQFGILALALLSYVGAVALGGNGFVAAFGAGIVFGSVSRRTLSDETEFAENLAIFASLPVWLLFGAVLVGPALTAGDLAGPVLFAVLALTVVRMGGFPSMRRRFPKHCVLRYWVRYLTQIHVLAIRTIGCDTAQLICTRWSRRTVSIHG